MKKAIEEKMWEFIFVLGAVIHVSGAFMWVEDVRFEQRVTKTEPLLAVLKKYWRKGFREEIDASVIDPIVEVLNLILCGENHTIFWPAVVIAALNKDLNPFHYRNEFGQDLNPFHYRDDFGQVLQLLLIAQHANPFHGPEGIEVYSDGMELPRCSISRSEVKDWLAAEFQKRFNFKPSNDAISAAIKAIEHIATENHRNNYWEVKVAWAKKIIGANQERSIS